MLLIEFNSISNMGGQKIKLSEWAEKKDTWQTHHAFVKYLFFQLIRTTNKKVLFLKKICGLLLFETLKIKKSDFLNNKTCFFSRLYSKWRVISAQQWVRKKAAIGGWQLYLWLSHYKYCDIKLFFFLWKIFLCIFIYPSFIYSYTVYIQEWNIQRL